MDSDIIFDFEQDLATDTRDKFAVPELPVGEIGQQPRNFVRNFRKTVCAFWIKGMCMKGDQCGFLHKFDNDRMPPCHTMLKKGVCNDPDCRFKHTLEDIKDCNMYALGFCIYGPECRYRHTRRPGPPPNPSLVEAAKPKQFRDINRVVNAVNDNVASDEPPMKRIKHVQHSKAAQPPPFAPRPPPGAPPPRPPSSAPPPLTGPAGSAPAALNSKSHPQSVPPTTRPPPGVPLPNPMRPQGGPGPSRPPGGVPPHGNHMGPPANLPNPFQQRPFNPGHGLPPPMLPQPPAGFPAPFAMGFGGPPRPPYPGGY